MTKQPKKATALDSTVKGQLAHLTLDNAKLTKENEGLHAENTAIRKQNVELASVIETDLKAGLKLNIRARSNYKESDLETLELEQLQQIDQTLQMGKQEGDATFKGIRAGIASEKTGRFTVGSLKGKTRDEILAMKGEF